MTLKPWIALLGILPFVNLYSLAADASQAERSLLLLCTQSPYNSRCEGRDWPTLMASRPGISTECSFLRGDFEKSDTCKVELSETALTIYREIGDPIPDLNDQKDTTSIEIPFDQIFAVSARVWSVRGNGLLTAWSDDDKANLVLSYISAEQSTAQSTDQADTGYRSNVLTLFTDAEEGFPFGERLMQLTPADGAEAIASRSVTTSTPVLSGEAAIAQLLETDACPQCDLRNANLAEADLDGVNLEGANLEGADLSNAKLRGAYLTGANLNRANLTGANLSSAWLTLATLIEANLQEANIASANLHGGNLQLANLMDVEAELAVFQQANLSQANLTRADLEGVNLFRANLESADLTSANLSDKAPSQSNYYGFGLPGLGLDLLLGPSVTYRFVTDLGNANLKNANLTDANLEDVVFINADLSDANLSNVDLADTDLSRATLCGTTMPDGTQSIQGCAVPSPSP